MDNSRKIVQTLEKEGEKVIERAQEVTDTAWEKGLETWKDLSVQGKEALSGAQKSAEDAWEDAEKLVQKHPGKAVGIALLVGAAIGALATFRKND